MKNFFTKYTSPPQGIPFNLYRRLLLTSNLAIAGIIISLCYILTELYWGNNAFVAYYAILTLGSAAALLLLKIHYYKLARITLLLSSLVVVSIYSSIEPYLTGIYMIQIVLALAAFTLFAYEDYKISMLLTFLIFLTFLVNFFYDFNVLQHFDYSEEYIKMSFALNFSVSIITSILMFSFISKTNAESENRMKINEIRLLKLTEELRFSKNTFELAIKGSSSGIYDLNIMTKDVFVSPIFKEILGYGDDDLNKADFEIIYDTVHPKDLDLLIEYYQNHFKTGETKLIHVRLKKENGQYVWVSVSGQAEWDEKGKPIRMVGAISDISHRKKAEEQLYRKNEMLDKANKELDQFVYSTSHDLRAPLSSILGLINILEISSDLTEKRNITKMMNSSVNRLNDFIDDIIEYSGNNRKDVTLDTINLKGMLDEILDNLEYFHQKKSIKIEFEFDQNIQIVSDKIRLRAILNNLVSNAIKYHNVEQAEPFIKINVSEGQDHYEIKIEDNGQGVDPEVSSNIFDMFFRGSEDSDGSGLGLYIAREMTEKLGGEINLLTNDPHTVFIVKLPIFKQKTKV